MLKAKKRLPASTRFFRKLALGRCEILWFCLLFSFVFMISGCAPRGESAPVEEVYEKAAIRFQRSLEQAPAQVAALELASLGSHVEKFLTDGAQKEVLYERLQTLIKNAGYTNRPAFTELIVQLGEDGNVEHKAQRYLLASRVFHTIASELESTGFQVEG